MSESDTVLVVSVEDNPGDARLIEEGIGAANADVDLRVFTNGKAAMETLTGDGGVPPESVNLVLLDINTPGLSGIELLRRLRGTTQYGDVPVVTLSSSTSPEDIKHVYEAGGNAYLTKPTDPDEFIQTVADAVRFWIPTQTGAHSDD